MWDQYTWIFGLSFVVAFACAFGIGANDVANSFGTSVGTKALTIGQAVCIAAVCEFLGAVLLGASVTDTIKSNIAKVPPFVAVPELLMFGMFWVMVSAAIWDNLACHLELIVSTTHTTIAAVVGMTVALQGFDGVVWYAKQPGFPYIRGMVPIFLSWVVSPLLAGIAVVIIYGLLLRPLVLRSQHSFARAMFFIPGLVGVTFFVIVYFIIQTGNKNGAWDSDISSTKAVWIAIIPAAAFALLTLVVVMPFIRKRILAAADLPRTEGEEGGVVDEEGIAISKEVGADDINAANASKGSNAVSRWFRKLWNTKFVQMAYASWLGQLLTYGVRYDVHDVIKVGSADFDQHAADVWSNAEQFDVNTEKLFRYLQVFSACVMSLAHGSNDVANAMGPFSAVYAIWSTQSVTSKTTVPEWILVIGGAGIVCGLALYGYKIMRALGVRTAKLSNSRGFCCELSTAIVVMVASRYGLPVSTTHTICGAVWTIGLFEGIKGVNWRMFAKTIFGWVMTLVLVSLLSAGLVSLSLYAPQKTAAYDIAAISAALGRDTTAMLNQVTALGGSNPSTLTALNQSVYPVFERAPRVAAEVVNTFNQALTVYNQTCFA